MSSAAWARMHMALVRLNGNRAHGRIFTHASLVCAPTSSIINHRRYKLPIRQCLNGLVQGMLHGWLDLTTFNMEEYEYYEV
jgi:hypothetical protein